MRSRLRQARSLVGPSRDDKSGRRIEARFDRLQLRTPNLAGEPQMYLMHLLKERRADPAFACLTPVLLARGAVRDHQRLYRQLTRARKTELKAEARQHARDSVVATADEADLLRARLDLHNLRRSQEREQVGIINHMDSFRMTDDDVVNMCEYVRRHRLGSRGCSVDAQTGSCPSTTFH